MRIHILCLAQYQAQSMCPSLSPLNQNTDYPSIFKNVIVLESKRPSEDFLFFFYILFIFDRQRQSTSGGGAERDGAAESEAGSRLGAVSTEPDTGLEPTNGEIVT